MAINKKLIHFNNFSTFNSQKLSANSNNDKYTFGIDGDIVDGNPDILYQSICYIKDTKQQWTHGQLYDCSSLISGENIKTINSQSILGEGNIAINEPYRAPFDITDLQGAVERGLYYRFEKDEFVTALSTGRPLEVPITIGAFTGIPASYYRETTADGKQIIVDVIHGTKVYHLVLDDIVDQPYLVITHDNTTCKDTSEVYITPYTLNEFIAANGSYLSVSKEFVEAAFNKKMILIPTGKTVANGCYAVATLVEAYDPIIETDIYLAFNYGEIHYQFNLTARAAAPTYAYCSYRMTTFVNKSEWNLVVSSDNRIITRPNTEVSVNSIDGAIFIRNGVRTPMTPNTVYSFTDNGVVRTIAVYDDHRLVITSADNVGFEYPLTYTSSERVLPSALPSSLVTHPELREAIEEATPDWDSGGGAGFIKNRTHFAGLRRVFNIGDKCSLEAYIGTHSPESYRLRYKGELYKLPGVGEKAYFPNVGNADFFIFLSESTSGQTTTYTISSTVINEAVAGTEVEVVADYMSKKLDDFYLPDNVTYNNKLKTINGKSIVGEGDIKTQTYIADFALDDLIGLARNDIDSIEISADILDAIADSRVVGIGSGDGYTIATRADWDNREELYLEFILNGVCYIIDGASTTLTDDRKFTIYSQSVCMQEHGIKPLYIDWVTLEEIRNAYDENGKQGISIPYPNEDVYNKIREAVEYKQQVYIKTYDYGSGYVELNIGTYEGEICCSAIDPEGYLIQFNITSPSEESLWIRRIDYLPNKQDIIEAMTPITWAELVNKRDNEELIAGTYYRITDYETTTAQADTGSAGNLFDVIVLALSENSLAEEAYAVHSERDTDGYFANSNLSAWKLWYCLDNDKTRFAWADTEIGKGVIYRMIDEFNNDVHYDFKNILFVRYELEAPDEYEAVDNGDKWIEQLSKNVREMFNDGSASYRWSGIALDNRYWESERSECYSEPTTERKLFYTFSYITDYESNTVVLDASLSSSCSRNKIAGHDLSLSNNVFLGNMCYSNKLGNYCFNNTFGDYCLNNTLGDYCSGNTFGYQCLDNTFDYGCYSNNIGNYCAHNTFGFYCYENCCDYSEYNNFGTESHTNILCSGCCKNTFGNECTYNTLGNGCFANTFGKYCNYNALDNDSSENVFGNSCINNTFDCGFYVNNTLGHQVRYIHMTYDGEPGAATYAQNYHISNDVGGTYEEPLVINVKRSRNYETTIAMNSNGEIVEFCVADFPSLIVKTLNTPV